jgi:pimeloyl-ACP methyl ester carboxylesterase
MGGIPSTIPVPAARSAAVAGAGAAGLLGLTALSTAVASFNLLTRVRPQADQPSATLHRVEPSPATGWRLRLTLSGHSADEPGWVGLDTPHGRMLASPTVPVAGQPGQVTRDVIELPGEPVPLLEPGDPVRVRTDAWRGCRDPLDLGARTDWIATDAGPLALTTAGDAESRRALVFVHGRGGERTTGWWFAPVCQQAGWRCVLASYRNGGNGAPSTGRYLLGGEWRDLVAVLDELTAEGVEEVVLVGWSMGGNVCASYLRARRRDPDRFAHHPRPVGLVLDAPALEWGRVLRHVARGRRLPRHLAALTMAYGRLAGGIDWRDLDHLGDPSHLDLPVLAFHGGRDPVVPVEISQELAERGADVRLEIMPDADHCRSINVEPIRYLDALADFLGHLETAASSPDRTAA